MIDSLFIYYILGVCLICSLIFYDILKNYDFTSPVIVNTSFILFSSIIPIILISKTHQQSIYDTELLNIIFIKNLVKIFILFCGFYAFYNFFRINVNYSYYLKIKPNLLYIILLIGFVTNFYFFTIIFHNFNFICTPTKIIFNDYAEYFSNLNLNFFGTDCGSYYNQHGFGLFNIFNSIILVIAVLSSNHKYFFINSLAKILIFFFIIKLLILDRKTNFIFYSFFFTCYFILDYKNNKNLINSILLVIALFILFILSPKYLAFILNDASRLLEEFVTINLLERYTIDPLLFLLNFDLLNLLSSEIDFKQPFNDFNRVYLLNNPILIDSVNKSHSIGMSLDHYLQVSFKNYYFLFIFLKGFVFGFFYKVFVNNDSFKSIYALIWMLYIFEPNLGIETLTFFFLIIFFLKITKNEQT